MSSLELLRRVAAGRTDLVLQAPTELALDASLVIDGATALQWSAYYGDTTAVRTLLAHGALRSQLGENLGLMAAAFHGHWQLCELLLESGALANASDAQTGETPLHAALSNEDRLRYDLVVRVLLAHGARPNAATVPHQETGAFMRDCRTKGETPLHRAAAFGTAATVQMLLDAGADRELLDCNGDSPLGWASWYRRPADVLHLLCFGPHQVRADRKSMRANLLGTPRT